jgi:hypothetical protein
MKNMNPKGPKIMAKEEIIGSKTFEQQAIKPNINSLSKRYKILYNSNTKVYSFSIYS